MTKCDTEGDCRYFKDPILTGCGTKYRQQQCTKNEKNVLVWRYVKDPSGKPRCFFNDHGTKCF